jgi:hypothetical protein
MMSTGSSTQHGNGILAPPAARQWVTPAGARITAAAPSRSSPLSKPRVVVAEHAGDVAPMEIETDRSAMEVAGGSPSSSSAAGSPRMKWQAKEDQFPGSALSKKPIGRKLVMDLDVVLEEEEC